MNITFIGGGNMASAIIGGLIGQGFDAGRLQAVEIIASLRDDLKRRFGIASYGSAEALPEAGDVVVLAVKPQQMQAAVTPLIPKLRSQVILSIAAGVRIADLARWLGGYLQIIRCMPNTPALIGAGITAAYAAPAVSQNGRLAVARVLQAVGKVVWVESEALLDPVTAISGSGPAYVFYFMEALRDAAVELGLSAETANTLVLETFVGAARLALQDGADMATLRERVTSKGGTTEAALKSMSSDRVKEAILRAVDSANQRARELGAELGKT